MISNRQLFLSHVAQTTDFPLSLEIEKASGVYLYDADGKEYIDLISGISVSNLGHCHPEVVKAVQQQVEQYMYLMVYGEYVYNPQVALATKLASLLPDPLESVYLVNSGAEATEGALKLAKRYTGRSEIVYFEGAYHGSTHGALSVMGNEYYRQAYRPLLPDTRMLHYNNFDDLENITKQTACVIIETVQAESGIHPPSEGYLAALRNRCDEVGALLILDEIQAGIGRTGKLFAFEHYGIVPDILLLAKALGGGMPIGAFIASREVMDTLKTNPLLGHITTFGGHPVTCAAALAALNVITSSTYVDGVAEKEQQFLDRLKHPAIKNIRHKGLWMALEFESFEQNKRIIDACIEEGVITDWFLYADNCLRIAPPLIIDAEQIDTACNRIIKCINQHA